MCRCYMQTHSIYGGEIMLVPAQNYREELQREMIARWYNPKYSHYFAGERGNGNIADNAYWRRDYVYLDDDGEVAGYFGYAFNETSKSMYNFGLIGFRDNNTHMVYEVLSHILYMFKSHQAQRAEFWAFNDNPANKLYKRFCRKYGGREAAHLHRSAYYDGAYHDTTIYELMCESVLYSLNLKSSNQIYDFGNISEYTTIGE